jgi:hypothetical protein
MRERFFAAGNTITKTHTVLEQQEVNVVKFALEYYRQQKKYEYAFASSDDEVILQASVAAVKAMSQLASGKREISVIGDQDLIVNALRYFVTDFGPSGETGHEIMRENNEFSGLAGHMGEILSSSVIEFTNKRAGVEE